MCNAMMAKFARDSVMSAVNNLFESLEKADTTLLKSCFASNAVLQTIQDN